MIPAIFILLLSCIALSLFEEKMSVEWRVIAFTALGAVMVLTAGLRGVDSTPDSDTYAYMFEFLESYDDKEISFHWIVTLLRNLGLGVSALFIVYAVMSISLRLRIIWKMSYLPFLTLAVYLSHFYLMHDTMQIRCAVASALFLFAVYYQTDRKHIAALCFILLGSLFHYSAMAGIVILLLNNKPLERWQRKLMYAIIPIGIGIYVLSDVFAGLVMSIANALPESFGGEQLAHYLNLKDRGVEAEYASWQWYLNIITLMNMALYYICIYFHKPLTSNYRYTPIMLKCMTIGWICLLGLHGFSDVLATRLSEYFIVVVVFLWGACISLMTPKLWGKILVNGVSFLRLLLSVFFYTYALLFV